MPLSKRELSRRLYVLAHVRSLENTSITIPPYSQFFTGSWGLVGWGGGGYIYFYTALQQNNHTRYLYNEQPYRRICEMVNSHIPADLEPNVITYDTARTTRLPAHGSNITINTVQDRPHALLCEIQQVKV